MHYSQINTEIESMTHVVKRLHDEGKLKAYFELQIVEGFAGNMLWKQRTLIYRKQFEAMLYHLVRYKRKYAEPVDLYRKIPDEFRIGKKKIYQTKKTEKINSINKNFVHSKISNTFVLYNY